MSSLLPATGMDRDPLGAKLRALFRGFGARHCAIALIFGFVVPIVYALFALAMGEDVRSAKFAAEVAGSLVVGFTAVLAAVAADNALRGRLGTGLRVTAAVLGAAAAATLLVGLLEHFVFALLGLAKDWGVLSAGGNDTWYRLLSGFCDAAQWSMVLIVLCELLESSRRAGVELHAARMAALHAERDLVEGDLRAMQARVDPELLFDSLHAIDQGYARDVALGQARLDALIRFLRAALPGDAAATSTVAREQELAEAYVALLGHRAASAARAVFAVEPAARHEPLPSMLLLPLTRWALAGNPRHPLEVRVSRCAPWLEIRVRGADAKDGGPEGDDIARLRDRLTHLYGGRARIEVGVDGGRRRALVQMPLASAALA